MARGAETLDGPAALNNPNQDNNDGQYKQDVDEPAQRVRRNHAQQPQHEQDDKDRPKHRYTALPSEAVVSSREKLQALAVAMDSILSTEER